MKKIFALIAAADVAASMISCEISDPVIRPLGSEELKDYAGKLLRKKMKRKNMPEDTEEYMEFNKYDINRKDVL